MSGSQDVRPSQQTSQFVKKLLTMINEHPDIIDFSSDGKQVIINNQQIFIRELLPTYFRHHQWRSFIRQMNMYQFRKLSRGVKTYIFVNQFFQRGNQSEYHLIKRKNYFQQYQNQLERELHYDTQCEIEKQYGLNTLSVFMSRVVQMKQDLKNNFLFIREQMNQINKQRKSNDNKHIFGGMRESIQMVQQSSAKFHQALKDYQRSSEIQNYGSEENLQSKKNSTSLVIPVIHKSQQNLEQKKNKQITFDNKQRQGNNIFEITPGGSFSSFQNL